MVVTTHLAARSHFAIVLVGLVAGAYRFAVPCRGLYPLGIDWACWLCHRRLPNLRCRHMVVTTQFVPPVLICGWRGSQTHINCLCSVPAEREGKIEKGIRYCFPSAKPKLAASPAPRWS